MFCIGCTGYNKGRWISIRHAVGKKAWCIPVVMNRQRDIDPLSKATAADVRRLRGNGAC
jgi:hypothetical protein